MEPYTRSGQRLYTKICRESSELPLKRPAIFLSENDARQIICGEKRGYESMKEKIINETVH
jgi:hypothetical protein